MIVDGKKVAEEILHTLETERAAFGAVILGVVMEGGDAATESFVKIKSRVAARLQVEVRRYAPQELTRAAAECSGVIVQLPLQNSDQLLAAIPPEKDVDGLSLHPKVPPPFSAAIAEIFVRCGISAVGKRAVVVGAGRLVGMPAAALLRDLGADLSVVTHTHGSLDELNGADIVVLGAGEPGLIKPEMLTQGVVLIDAGTSEQGGKLAGDADPRRAEVSSAFTPVPGGVGPIAVAMLFKNLFTLAKRTQE